MQTEIQLGLVGYGHRGKGMLGLAVNSFPSVRAAAICDCNAELLAGAENDFPGVPRFTDFDTMLEAAPMDALLVETPATCHARFCAAALRKGIYVMGDVPCVESIAQARLLWEAQQQSTAFYMIGANPNMWGFIEAAVDLQRKGLLGDPYYLEAEYIHDVRELFAATPWRETLECITYCTHSLGPLLRLIPEDLCSVACFDTGSHIDAKPGRHDAMTALFHTASNVVLRFTASFINNYPHGEHHYKVYGTKGYFERTPAYTGPGSARTFFYSTEWYGPKRLVELPVHEPQPQYAGQAQGHGGADYALFARFFHAIRENLPSPIDLREALRMTLPGLYAAESARRGGELVQIEYPWN